MSDRLLQSFSLTFETLFIFLESVAERTIAEGRIAMKNFRQDVFTYAICAVVVTFVVKRTWAAIPSWAKRDDDNDDDDNCRDANDELASPRVIIKKLASLRKLTDDMVEESFELPWFKMYASFLSYVHLKQELELLHPEHRNNRYRADGAMPDLTELQKLDHHCQFARWAYLKSYLESHAQIKTRGFVCHECLPSSRWSL